MDAVLGYILGSEAIKSLEKQARANRFILVTALGAAAWLAIRCHNQSEKLKKLKQRGKVKRDD